MNNSDSEKMLGCFMAIFTLAVTAPMWLVLLFGILIAIGDSVPTWTWVLYWVYVPCNVIGVIVAAIAKQLLD